MERSLDTDVTPSFLGEPRTALDAAVETAFVDVVEHGPYEAALRAPPRKFT